MKKILLLAAAAITMASCSKDNTVTTTQGEILDQREVTITAMSDETGWMFTDNSTFPSQSVAVNGDYYFHSFHMTDFITSEVCTSGKVDVYMYVGTTQSKLPYTRHYIDPSTKKIWTTTVDFVYEPGYIHIYNTRSDFPATIANPGQQKFRIVTSTKI